MGCHTYFYIPTDIEYKNIIYEFNKELNYSIETIKFIKKAKLVSIGKSNKKYINILDNKEDGNYSLDFEKEYQRKLKLFFRLKRVVKKGLCKKAVLNRLGYAFHNNLIYDLCDVYDLFRVSGYPDVTLSSYKETIDFIDTYGLDLNKKSFVDYSKLEEFFSNNLTGIIKFGI